MSTAGEQLCTMQARVLGVSWGLCEKGVDKVMGGAGLCTAPPADSGGLRHKIKA